MPKDLGWTVDSNFIVPGFGLTGPAQPVNLDRSKFVSESALDTAIGTIHKAADLPYLTMNDKVFAARYSVAVTIPRAEVEEVEPEVELTTYEETASK